MSATITTSVNTNYISQVNFASLFASPYQSVQTDLGLTYGSILLATGTTPPVITLSGSLITVPVPITVNCTLLGARGTWTGTYSFDGGLTTTPFTSSATIPLTGAGSGLTLNIATGTAAVDNVWRATCSGLADQTTNGFNYSQAAASLQPIITVGLNGRPGLLFDGVDDFFQSSFTSQSTMMAYLIVRQVGYGSFKYIVDGSSGNTMSIFQSNLGSGIIGCASATVLTGGQLTIGSFGRIAVSFNGASSSIKVGNTALTNGTSGVNASGTTRYLGKTAGGAPSNIELLALIYAPLDSITAIDSTASLFYGGLTI